MRKDVRLLSVTIIGSVFWIAAAPPRCGAG